MSPQRAVCVCVCVRNQLFKVRERTSCFPCRAAFGVSAVITTDRWMHTGVKVGSHGPGDWVAAVVVGGVLCTAP